MMQAWNEIVVKQKEFCSKNKLDFEPIDPYNYIKISKGFDANQQISGLRYSPTQNANGWYLWNGEQPKNEGCFIDIDAREFAAEHNDLAVFLGIPTAYGFNYDGQNFEITKIHISKKDLEQSVPHRENNDLFSLLSKLALFAGLVVLLFLVLPGARKLLNFKNDLQKMQMEEKNNLYKQNEEQLNSSFKEYLNDSSFIKQQKKDK